MAKAQRTRRPTPAEQGRARVFDALGSPVRRKIVEILSEGATAVGDLADQLPVSRPAVSRHLKLLEEADLVVHEQRGTSNVYRLEPRGFSAARRWLDAFWDEAIARFALLAENLPDPNAPDATSASRGALAASPDSITPDSAPSDSAPSHSATPDSGSGEGDPS